MSLGIFISHNDKDHPQATELRQFLATLGYSCWMAPDDTEGGQPALEQIINAIEKCRLVIVLLSKNALDSGNVPREINTADQDRQKLILPTRLEDAQLTGTLQYLLGLSKAIDAFPGKIANHFKSIQESASSLMGEKEESPKKRRKWPFAKE